MKPAQQDGWPLVNPDFTVRFWGVRGSIACPGPDTIRYGGNTSCVEMRCGERLLIFDGGSGLRPLGQELLRTARSLDFDLFYTTTHFDHIVGLPFFPPSHAERTPPPLTADHLTP